METTDSAQLVEVLARLSPVASYRDLVRAARLLRKVSARGDQPGQSRQTDAVRVTLVGNTTLSFMVDPMMAYLAQRNLAGDITVGEYDSYIPELLNPNSEVLRSSPDFIAICVDHHSVHTTPRPSAGRDECRRLAREQVDLWQRLWQTAHDASGCTILQTNVATPIERPLGIRDSTGSSGRINFFREINRLLAEEAPTFVTICDAEHLSAIVGKSVWFNEAQWHNIRQACGFEGVSLLSHALAAIIAARRGKSRKCLVLDLDNTLWGGVVGDVGVENLKLQRGDAIGEAYLDFQSYCLSLHERGVLLAVCSKNEENTAKQVFTSHSEMVLRLKHISAFMANWDNKAKNIQEIAKRLNLGVDALVFVDDHPAERDLVRQVLPAVAVPEMPDDPAHYRRTLDAHNYFEVVDLSAEDLGRGSQYIMEQKRKETATQFDNLDEFLASLEQKCTIDTVGELTRGRTIQLLNKTNQFNTTTTRYEESRLLSRTRDPRCLCLCVRHADRFGDNGIISNVIAEMHDNAMTITDWVMSCRVFNRGIEQAVFAELIAETKRRGARSITGLFRPTERNGVVANLYRDFGFLKVESVDDGVQRWHLADLDKAVVKPHSIMIRRGTEMSISQREEPHESKVA